MTTNRTATACISIAVSMIALALLMMPLDAMHRWVDGDFEQGGPATLSVFWGGIGIAWLLSLMLATGLSKVRHGHVWTTLTLGGGGLALAAFALPFLYMGAACSGAVSPWECPPSFDR